MSHSKMTKRGSSLYVEKWNPKAKKYINICSLCGDSGYSPTIDCDGFCDSFENRAIQCELKKVFSKALALDEYGRCSDCVSRQNK